jgi:hypothetical protein
MGKSESRAVTSHFTSRQDERTGIHEVKNAKAH